LAKRSFAMTLIAHLAVLYVVLVSFDRPALADVLDSFNDLAFPEMPSAPVGDEALKALNSFGVVKLTSKIKVCVFGVDDVARISASDMLRRTVDEFPPVATQFLDLDCSNVDSLDATGIDAVIWISQTILEDVDEYLEVPLYPDTKTYREMAIRFIRGKEFGMYTITVNILDKSVQGRLLIKQNSSPEQVRAELLRFVFFLLNPKSSIAKLDSKDLVNRSEDGNTALSDMVTNYLSLLYSGNVKLGDSKAVFFDAAQHCIAAGNC
jgi:hypothetical protein